MNDHTIEGRRIVAWAIIEQAGYVGENDIGGRYATEAEAYRALKRQYDADEIEDMHVSVAGVEPDGSFTYDF